MNTTTIRRHQKTRGFTLVETLISISLFGIVAGVALPVVPDAREEARRIQCAQQIGLLIQGSLDYQEVNLRMPPLTTGSGPVFDLGITFGEFGSHQNTGAMTYILPFIGQQEIFDLIPAIAKDPELTLFGSDFQNFNQLLGDPSFRLAYTEQLDSIICPSNATYKDALIDILSVTGPAQCSDFPHPLVSYRFVELGTTEFGRSSYVPSMGGFHAPYQEPIRAINFAGNLLATTGAFRNRFSSIGSEEIPDGASNTIGWAECNGWITEDSSTGQPFLEGAHFALFGNSVVTGFSFSSSTFGSAEFSSPFQIGSNHPEGNNVAMCDGSIRFINRNTSRQVMASLGCGDDGWIIPR